MAEDQVDVVDTAPLGPVDYVVIEFADAKFNGTGLPILLDLVANGTIRVLDAVVIKANDDGTWMSLSVEDLGGEGGGEWELVTGWSSDVPGSGRLRRGRRHPGAGVSRCHHRVREHVGRSVRGRHA